MRLADIDRVARTVEVWDKGDKSRIFPIPPQLFEQLEAYVESRRPAHLAVEEWWRSDEFLLRRPPAGMFPLGRPAGRRRIEDLFTRLRRYASAVGEAFGAARAATRSSVSIRQAFRCW